MKKRQHLQAFHAARDNASCRTRTQTQPLEQSNSQPQSKLEIGKMAGPTKPRFRRRVNRPQHRRWFGFRNIFQWPRFDRDMKVCGVLVVPVLGILALLAVWVYVVQQTVRDHVVYYILDTDQSWMGLLVEGIIALALFGVLMRVVRWVNSE